MSESLADQARTTMTTFLELPTANTLSNVDLYSLCIEGTLFVDTGKTLGNQYWDYLTGIRP